MNRKEIRDLAKTLLSRDVPDADLDFAKHANRCIDLAYRKVASEVPGALVPDTDVVYLIPEKQTGVGGVTMTVSTTADPYVLDLGLYPAIAPNFNVVTDGTWDGVMWITVTMADGSKVRRQCREFWTVAAVVGVSSSHQYVSLVHPIRASASFSARPFRLYQPFFYLTNDVENVLDGNLYDVGGATFTQFSEGFCRQTGVLDNGSTTVLGQPTAIVRSNAFQLDAPNVAPKTSIIEGTFAPEGRGQFQYLITYAWGKRDVDIPTEGNTLVPQFESGPSPVSALVTVDVNQSIKLDLPDIDWEVNYHTAGTLRSTYSGLVKRIYRARYTVTTGTITALETPQVFQFLAEVGGEITTFTDDGTLIPEYYARVPEVPGYYAYRCVPQQSARYVMNLRVTRRPRALSNDHDEARVSAECADALAYTALQLMALYDEQPNLSTFFRDLAKEAVDAFRARHANPSKVVVPSVWGVGGGNWAEDMPHLTYTRFTGP